MNYTGLRKGDADFEGYISNGDINRNGLIDAYDISVIATQLDGGINVQKPDTLAGQIRISTSKKVFEKGEAVNILVQGIALSGVNAWSLALPYSQQDYEYVGVEPKGTQEMENLTYDRLHSNGTKALYPTFVNVGNKPVLAGTKDLCVLKFVAKRKVKFNLKATDVILVDKELNDLQ